MSREKIKRSLQNERIKASYYNENVLDFLGEYDKPVEVKFEDEAEENSCYEYESQYTTCNDLEDEEKPYVKIRDFNSLNADELEEHGILTDRYVEVGSYCLDKTALPGKIAITKCNLSEMGLTNIDIISYHQFLQHLDLSRNKLTTLSALSYLPFLKDLDASHNLLTNLLEFKAPLYLLTVNCSHNLIEKMVDLTDFWSLSYLNLSNNSIVKIRGLRKLKYLLHLDLSFNKIEYLDICHLQLRELYLDHNNISDFETGSNALSTNGMLATVSISYNKLTTLKIFEDMKKVENVNASHNLISDLIDLNYLRTMPHLQVLSLSGNEVSNNPKYSQLCLYLVPMLMTFDEEPVDVIEKGKANYLYTHRAEKSANLNNINMEILKSFTKPVIDTATIPGADKAAQIIIVLGPIASQKTHLIDRLVERCPKLVKKGVSYTTRSRLNYEVEGRDYYFVSEEKFRELMLSGQLICCTRKFGSNFGLAYKELSKISQQVGILMLQLDITSALQLRAKFLNCKLIIAIPSTEKVYKRDLCQKFYCSPWISDHIKGHILNYKNEIRDIFDKMLLLLDENLDEMEEYRRHDTKSVETYSPEARSSHFSSKYKIGDVYQVEESARPSNKSILKHSSKGAGKGSQVVFAIEPEIHNPTPRKSEMAVTDSASQYVDMQELDSANQFCLASASISKVPRRKSTEVDEDSIRHKHMPRSASEIIHHRTSSFDSGDQDTHSSGSSQRRTLSEQSIDSSISSDWSGTIDERSPSYNEFFLTQTSNENVKYEDAETKRCLEYFMDQQCQRRRLYIDSYTANPGLFLMMIRTDEEGAFDKLLEVVKQCIYRQNKKGDCKVALNPDMQNHTLNLLKKFMK